MASPSPNLNGSQILVTLTDSIPSLDGKHTVFGRIAEGLDVLDKINELLIDKNGNLLQNCRFSFPFLVPSLSSTPASIILSFYMIHFQILREWKHSFHLLHPLSTLVSFLFVSF